MHEGQKRIGIAIISKLDDLLRVAAGGALVPQLLAAAAPKHRLAALERQRQAFGVHPRHHEHLARFHVLHDARDQPVGVVFQLGELGLHGWYFL